MVPEGWTETHLGEVITHQKGFAFNSGSYRDKGIRIVRISDTTRNSVHSENPVYVTEEDASELERYKLTKDDIILSTVGSRPHLLDSMVGKAVKVPLEADGSLLNQNLVKIKPVTSKITNEYLYEMLKNKRFIFFISTLVRGNANQVSITLSDFFKYQFSLPPLPEQKKIAQILSTWDKAITTTEQLLVNSQQQKKALMQQLLTGKKRLLDENGVRFSGEWKITTVSQMGKVVSGGTPDTNTKEYWDGDIHWLTPTDVTALKSRFVRATTRTISEAGVQNSSATILPAGSLMVCTRATIGALCISSGPICTNQGFKNIIPTKAFDVNFIYYLLAYNSKVLLRKASGSTFLELPKKDFEKMAFPCPFLEEQQRIAAVLSTADEEIAALQQKLDALKQEKKALMQQLLTGKRRVETN